MIDASTAERIRRGVASHEATIAGLWDLVQRTPELAHDEYRAAAALCEALAKAGLRVERPIAGMDTAFRATLEGDAPGPTVGIVAVYDAVPGLGDDGTTTPLHACGHPTIAAGVVGAVAALADRRDDLAGRVVVVGCPADEIHAPGTVQRGGGKALTTEAGVWDDVDVALYVHPEFIDTVSLESQWMRRERLVLTGSRSLVDGTPQGPLDALERLLAAVRSRPAAHVMLESAVLDGDVEEGSALRLAADVLVIDETEQKVDDWAAEVRAEVGEEGWSSHRKTPGIRPDARVTGVVADAFDVLGRRFEAQPPPLPFATDFGVISRRVPAALVGLGREGGWAFHTPRGADEFGSPEGRQAAFEVAELLGLCVTDLLEHWLPAEAT